MLFRPSTLEERKEFYENEFNAEGHIRFLGFKPQIYAVDMGSESKIILNKEKLNKMINFMTSDIKAKALKYLPEDIYFDRNFYKDPNKCLKEKCFKKCPNCDNYLGQLLAFDVDASNIKCSCKDHLCNICLEKAKENAIAAADILKEQFKKVRILYSGRGFHVYIFDNDSTKLKIKEREEINKKLKKYAIDPWVSRGYIRLMRLPYSLHGLISRIVMPLESEKEKEFSIADKKLLPNFMKK